MATHAQISPYVKQTTFDVKGKLMDRTEMHDSQISGQRKVLQYSFVKETCYSQEMNTTNHEV